MPVKYSLNHFDRPEPMSTLGTKIRKLRELRNLKQEHMADVLGISQSSYSKIEKDETEVGHERLEQIAKALDLSVQDILAFDEKMIFNIMHNTTGIYNNGGTHYHQFTDELKKLYEDKIKLLEEMNEMLKRENEKLRGK